MDTSHARALIDRCDDQMNGRFTPPAYGTAQREAINAVVHSLSTDICQRAKTLHGKLDDIERMALQNASSVDGVLADFVSLCTRLNAEITRIDTVIGELHELVHQ